MCCQESESQAAEAELKSPDFISAKALMKFVEFMTAVKD